MKIAKYLVLTFICLVFAATGFAQEKAITKEEYLNAEQAALQKAQGLTRTVEQMIHTYDGDKISIDAWQYDYVMPDKIHYLNIRTVNGKDQRTEEIDIGKKKYCKKGDGEWTLVSSPCVGGSASAGPSNIVSDEYFLEKKTVDGKKVKVFRNYTTYKDVYSPTKGTDGLSFQETQFELNSDDLIVRETTKRGLLDPRTTRGRSFSNYKYDPTIKIEAPIK